jgi:tetrahydromethanopterin S-methyltransferase subunit G
VTGETHRMDSLSTVISAKDSMIINLNKKLGELADSKDKEIKKIRNLGAKESKDWLENKLKEIDNIDSLQFFSSDSSVIIGINGIRTINGLLVDRDYLKKQVEYSDSIMTVQREQLVLKDSLFETIKIREQKELQYYDEKTGTLETELSKEKKQKKTWKIGTGVGILGGVIIGLLL